MGSIIEKYKDIIPGHRDVTEDDFRKDEFKGANLEDYELDCDDKPVRKDRWKMAIFSIKEEMHLGGTYEIKTVVECVEEMAAFLDVLQQQFASPGPDVKILFDQFAEHMQSKGVTRWGDTSV